MKTYYPIAGVGLGPGDPDLITVKGLRMLEMADVIFYPATEISEGRVKSYSLPILQKLGVDSKAMPLLLPMNSKEREKHYNEAFSIVAGEYDKGLKVVIVSEGDILFYSTFGYILKLIKKERIPFYLIPGIPAFVLGASESGTPLVEGKTPFSVVALPASFDEVKARLDSGDALVVMKPKALKGWDTFLSETDRPFYYTEYLGTAAQYITTNASDLTGREVPYFAIIIFPGIG